MIGNEDSQMRPSMDSEPHQEFLELCARSTSGLLSREEQRRLNQHLAVCAVCRRAMEQYKAVVDHAIPTLGAEQLSQSVDPGPGWSEERVEAALFQRIAREEQGRGVRRSETQSVLPDDIDPMPAFADPGTWQRVWALYAAAVVLLIALGFSAYRVGIHRTVTGAKAVPSPAASTPSQSALEALLSDASHEREVAQTQTEQRKRQIRELRRQLQQQAAEMNELQLAQSRLADELRSGEHSRQDLLAQRTELAQ